jgi:hypothetical protein
MFINPAVNVEDWPEPPDPEESDAEDEPAEEPVDGDHDPEFVEQMPPLGLNVVDEPEVGYEELADFLEAHLYDMDEEEWIDMCKF